MELKGDHIVVEGRRFHFAWLRDNCPCPRCRDADSFQKIYDPCDREAVALAAERDGDALLVTWSDDAEAHRIKLAWLAANTYDVPPPAPAPVPALRLWDAASINAQPEVIRSPSAPEEFLGDLVHLGFARIGGLPREDLPAFIGSLGPVAYASKQVDFVDVKIIPGGEDLSLTSHALSPHTDQSYMAYAHPLVLVLHAIENTVTGGESILVDGFKVAEDLARERPEDYAVLARTTVTFRQYEPQLNYFFNRSIRTLELDADGKLKALHFSHKNFTVDLPFEEMGAFYAAYTELLRRMKSPAYQYVFPLQPGQCLLMANHRVLHGRNAFDAASGIRHFSAGFLPRNYIDARLAFGSSGAKARYLSAA